MSFILQIETATTACSVALSRDGVTIAQRETDAGYTHAENLHNFIRQVLAEADVDATRLEAVAVSRGPGSYTGLRIGASAAKGMSFALDIPLIAIDTLQIMSSMARMQLPRGHSAGLIMFPFIDARRMEVYTAPYDLQLVQQRPTQALIVDEKAIDYFTNPAGAAVFGNGMEKCRQVLSTVPGIQFLEGITPSASHMSAIARERLRNRQFEDTASFEPYYLKEFVAKTKKAG